MYVATPKALVSFHGVEGLSEALTEQLDISASTNFSGFARHMAPCFPQKVPDLLVNMLKSFNMSMCYLLCSTHSSATDLCVLPLTKFSLLSSEICRTLLGC